MFSEYILSPIHRSLKSRSQNNAFFINDTYFSYNDLLESISKIRSAVQAVSSDSNNFGLVANDDIETYASIIALWLQGYAYVPIHPRYPIERSLEIFRQAGVEVVLDSSLNSQFRSLRTIESKGLKFESDNLIPLDVSDQAFAYILFTSGSTGRPKGVPISRGNLGAFMKAFWDVGFEIDENDRCLQCFDLTFDVSVQSFLVPISRGACIYTIPHDRIKPSYAYSLMEEHKLTFGAMAPSMVRFLKPYFDEISLPNLKYNILTAEASPLGLIEEWSNCIPNAVIYDFYGPTEATIYCTYSQFRRNQGNKHLNGMMTIGKPMVGISAVIIDENGKLMPANHKGELCVAGKQVTQGYWGNPEKNRDSFINIQVGSQTYKFYKTGDICFLDDEGDLMYAGRKDYQVKVQGFRVELGEIEYHAREFLKGQQAIAVLLERNSGNTEIVLCVEVDELNKDELMKYLKSVMPYYMVPSKIIELEQMPLNINGKIDRNHIKNDISQYEK